MTPKRSALALLALGILLGVAVWLFSPWLTGKLEPWDADVPICSLSWLVVAVLRGLVGHARGVCLPLGYGLGQMLITVQFALTGEFGVLGWMFIGAYAAVAVVGTLALVGAAVVLTRLCRLLDTENDDL